VLLVLDKNTVISRLLWGGTPRRVIDAARDARIDLASSAGLLNERFPKSVIVTAQVAVRSIFGKSA
jgi:predicted nucleic acid-binding protein